MRVHVQRVTEASCKVDGSIISKIANGYLLLVGFTHTDTLQDVQYMAKKIANLRIFEDEDGKLNLSIIDKKYEILSISEFTLYGATKKGNRPSFTEAMAPTEASALYEALTLELKTNYHIPVKMGAFGEYMEIQLVNDGPVTILLES